MDFLNDQLYAVYKKLTSYNISMLKVKGQIKTYHANTHKKEAMVDKLITEKEDFRAKNLPEIKRIFHVINRTIYQEDMKILNVYVLNNRAPNYVKRELKIKIDKSSVQLEVLTFLSQYSI